MADEIQPMDEGLSDSIAMLEQILEVMPDDLVALKALYNAYLQAGDQDHAIKYLCRLAEAVIADGTDTVLAEFVSKQLDALKDHFPDEVARFIDPINVMITPAEPVEEFVPAGLAEATDISEELTLAWKLFDEGQLTKDEYSGVLHDLSEVSIRVLDIPISVVHVLSDRGLSNIDRIVNYMSSRSGAPCISLASFEQDEELLSLLPLDMLIHDGVIPFGSFGNDLQLAVLNPFKEDLFRRIESMTKRKCHIYMVLPYDYDTALEKIREQLKDA